MPPPRTICCDPPVTPQAVVLDLGGVLFRYRPERRLETLRRLTGLSAAEIRRRLMDSGYSRSCDAGRLRGEAVHAEANRLLGRRLGLQTFQGAWISAFEPDPQVVALARRLKDRVPLALLTNNSDLVRDGLETAHPEVMELFRPRLFSAEAGLLKPDPRFFATLLELLGTSPPQVLYVDDEPACADAAAALGMRAVRFEDGAALCRVLTEAGLTG